MWFMPKLVITDIAGLIEKMLTHIELHKIHEGIFIVFRDPSFMYIILHI